MSQRILIILSIFSAIFVPAVCQAQTCASSVAPGWSQQLRQLFADCDNDIRSPDKKLTFRIGAKEKISVFRQGKPIHVVGKSELELPAVVSWSPQSDLFFLNDGNGSGLSSQLRLFRILGQTVREERDVNALVTQIYRTQNHCSNSSENPNVYGIGWSDDGRKLNVVVQASVNKPCGKPDNYLGFIVNSRTLQVEQTLLTAKAKSEFGRNLPQELR